jgi:arginine/lysine/ornithine decarboxylase
MLTPIHDFLTKYAAANCERAHMPGHRGAAVSGYDELPVLFDITEINQESVDIIESSERVAAELFGAKRTLFSCAGSTLAIFAMLAPFANKRVGVIGSFHRSFVDAAILLDFEIVRDFAAADAVFATSIDYYGRQTNTENIVNTTAGTVLIDNAHGAYLVFTDKHPIRLGAAMCADSAHKTLPALTGAAYLHIADEAYITCAQSALALAGTSSPSYLILDSLDLCNIHLANEKNRAITAFSAVAGLKSDLMNAGYAVQETDLLRVTVDVNAYGYTGRDFAGELKNRKVVCEMQDSRYVILLFSTITQEKNTRRVFEAMRSIPKKTALVANNCQLSTVNCQLSVMSPRAAYFSKKRTIAVSDAAGEVCAGVCVSIPPCVPLIIPGEIISREIAQLLEDSGIHEIDVTIQ